MASLPSSLLAADLRPGTTAAIQHEHGVRTLSTSESSLYEKIPILSCFHVDAIHYFTPMIGNGI